MLSPGHIVGQKYRIVRLIGEGGMGSVYEARHEVLGNHVALKFLHPEIASQPGLEQRFLQEAKLSATIDNPHIVRVSDVDKSPEGAYLVMELLQGEPLQALMDREGPLGTDRSIRFTLQVLDGLTAAHRLGVVHRDLKPDNVFLTPGNAGPLLKLLDFGIAKLRAEEGYQMTLTRPGAIMGTPEYMAPEQAYSADLVDQRSDLYAVGVMLFEMLSGKRPADGDTPQEIAEKTIKKQVLRLGELCPHLPPALVDVVHHAIAASPDDRFPDAGTMQRALQPFTPMTMGAASTVDRSTAASTPFFTVSKTPKIGEHYTSAVAGEGDRRSAVVPTVPPTDGPPIVATQDQKAKTASMPEVAGPPVVSRLPHAGAAPAATLPPGPAPVATHHRPRRRRSSWLWLAPLLVLVGAAAGATWYYYEFLHYDPPPPPQPVRRTTPVASTATPTDALDPAEEDDEAPAIAQPSPQPRPSPRGNAPTPRPADPVPTLPTFQLPTNLPLPTALPTTLPTTLPTSLPTLFPLPSAPAVPEQPAPPPAPTN